MINVSQTIKNSCKADKNTHAEYIVINNKIIYIKGKLNATAYKNTTFFGTFNMKVLEFETENTTQFRNREFEYYKVIDGNSFKLGTFITTEVVDNDSTDTIKVTANDYALKFAVPYTSQLDYESGNVTLFNVLEECCTNADVVLDNITLDNGNFIVDSNQFVNGELIGDVICAIGGISGNFATITEQDKLKLLFTTDTDEVLEDYTDLNDKRDTHPITSVSIGTSQVEGQEAILRDETLIEQYGEHWLTINDNPFAYTLEKRQELVTAIFNKVKGFGYSSFKSEYTYRPYLTLGDKIKFKNKSGQLIDSIILRYEMNFDDCTFEAPSVTSATIDYKKTLSSEELAKRAEIIANQAAATLTSVVSQVTTIEQEINGETTFELTKDTQYEANKEYYAYDNEDDTYVLLQEDIDYQVGDAISGDIYEITITDNLSSQLANIKETLATLDETLLKQTSDQFEMLFKKTGIADDYKTLKDIVEEDADYLSKVDQYIRFAGASIELGKRDNPVKLVITNDRISFMTGDTESAYISNNQLYITDSTILNKLRLGHWETKEDNLGNLNTRWVND